MKRNIAAGLLMCRDTTSELEFFLVHPGGPYFQKKENGFWTIPKGIPEGSEALIDTARREFLEETGIPPRTPFYELGSIKQKGGKEVYAWAFKGSWEPAQGITCNSFALEWPPRSGKTVNFPEVDRAAWMGFDAATTAIIPEQLPFLLQAINIFGNRNQH